MTVLFFNFLVAVAVTLAASTIIAFTVADMILGWWQRAKANTRAKYLSGDR